MTEKRTMQDTALICLGCGMIAVGFSLFLAPNQIASGGVQGISLLVRVWGGLPMAWTQWMLNVPLFLLGWIVLGRAFALKTLVGSLVLPFFVLWLEQLPAVTHQPILATVYGGVLTGLGLGFVYRAGASTGGWDIVAQLVTRWSGVPLGVAVGLCDGLVIAGATIFFGVEQGLLAGLGVMVMAMVIQKVQPQLPSSHTMMVHEEKQKTKTLYFLK